MTMWAFGLTKSKRAGVLDHRLESRASEVRCGTPTSKRSAVFFFQSGKMLFHELGKSGINSITITSVCRIESESESESNAKSSTYAM